MLCGRFASSTLFRFNRCFSSEIRWVNPSEAAIALKIGNCTIVDVRGAVDDVRIKGSVHIPASQFWVDRSVSDHEKKSLPREQLVNELNEDELDKEAYMNYGQEVLIRLRRSMKNPNATHEEAQLFHKNRLRDMRADPKAWADACSKRMSGTEHAQVDKRLGALKPQLTAGQDAFVRKLELGAERYLDFKPNPTKQDLAAKFATEDLLARWRKKQATIAVQRGLDDLVNENRAIEQSVLKQLPQDKNIYLVCIAGLFSERVARTLLAVPSLKDRVFVVKGGVDRWVLQGFEVDFLGKLAARCEALKTSLLKDEPDGMEEIHRS